MTKGGKLTKIKSVLKKMQSFKIGRVNSINNTNMLENNAYNSYEDDNNNNNNNNNLHPVYVGKSRRRYLVTSDVIDHPLFRELIERRTSDSEEYVSVGCEVVLFEHLLWMLQNADPQPESMDELVEFYSC
ncbi:auxin-responsive protein SAUR76-like [Solanum stenotomum]|uniref:auxin-responsive protein SAUR76-like n=1 Tax=Solanum stenotomum TaxID=172797 RepID=UPI0020CFF9C0|nr:auxin-responsive protein SAUR76-like [Solanum stenotomum]